ncbi:hypothetical protein ABIE26_002719 [Pedobacter africanus]|uniref:Uncharacterized protein n=1 Tax=Pedobacter africanus TaxID=151894 RepID=A0ACC6KXM5_9SPHI|nr:hypothetical protein [Pedobacter africanus]MDR6783892.1 hypothetical protein [Pedobacter africanus]
MKKLLLFTMLTFGLTTIFSLSSFSQNHPPPDPPPPTTGPVVSVSVFTDLCRGELFFNTYSGEFRNGNLYFFSGGTATITSVDGNLMEVYRGVIGPDGTYPWGQNYYYHFEGVLTYRFSYLGPRYTLDLDGSNNTSAPY